MFMHEKTCVIPKVVYIFSGNVMVMTSIITFRKRLLNLEVFTLKMRFFKCHVINRI